LTTIGAKFFKYASLSFRTFSMYIMLGTCVPNLKSRRWVEHTQMHLVLKKGIKYFYYTSNFWGIFRESTFLVDKNSMNINGGYKGLGVP
jgi:hypothetical protein